MTSSNQHYDAFTSIGFTSKGAAKDRASLFAAAGIEWPDHARTEIQPPRFTDYPFSVDISNNRLLVSLDRRGNIRRCVAADGVEDARGHTGAGIYMYKQLAFCQGNTGIDITVNGRICEAPELSFQQGLVPIYTILQNAVSIRQTVFVPQSQNKRPLCVAEMLEIKNTGDIPAHVSVSIHSDVQGVPNLRLLHPSGQLYNSSDGSKGAAMEIVLPALGSQQLYCLWNYTMDSQETADFSRKTPPRTDPLAVAQAVQSTLETTVQSIAPASGYLSTPDDPWYGEVFTRAGELARQSLLLGVDGKASGTFSGSNANPQPAVWFRDYGYTVLGLIETQPKLAVTAIAELAQYAIPTKTWGTGKDARPNISGFEHSIGNACLPLVLSSLLVHRYGRSVLDELEKDPIFKQYAISLADDLIQFRPKAGKLYSSTYISDGPSRGDYHTGSNILAWRAALGLSNNFQHLVGSDKADILVSIYKQLEITINRCCVAEIGNNLMFTEGVYADGNIVGLHDGEESDLALSSIYGFTPRDDKRIQSHARWALSPHNPYYVSRAKGIDYWDFDDSNGITYPSYLLGLCAARDRRELGEALSTIRQTTDIDGSFWWWPFKHNETNMNRVQRGLGKSGWCAGEFVSLVFNIILGIDRDQEHKTLTVAPYTPWKRFSLSNLAFARGFVDIESDSSILTVTNKTDTVITVNLQLPVPQNEELENILLNKDSHRYEPQIIHFYDGAAVACQQKVPANSRVSLQLVTRQN